MKSNRTSKILLYLSILSLPLFSLVYAIQIYDIIPNRISNLNFNSINTYFQHFLSSSGTIDSSSISSSSNSKPIKSIYPAYELPEHLDPLSITVEELNHYFNNGSSLTSYNLVLAYLHAIERNNHQNLNLRAIIEVASSTSILNLAKELDEERVKKGSRSGMHGIPILIKDNIATLDEFNTTAGSYALLGSKVPQDAFIISKLRAAGAIIIGKSSLSEWANYKGKITNGWSARGGQTQSPYVVGGFEAGGDPCGSSSGSGVGVAAGFAPIAIGTETDGSIICPGNRAALFALKPTVGLTSRNGIIPISHTQDSPGPMARSAWDVALILEIISGVDEGDEITSECLKHDTNSYLDAIPSSTSNSPGFKDLKIGIPRSHFYSPSKTNLSPDVYSAIESAFTKMSSLGANLIDPANLPSIKELWSISFSDRDTEGQENGVKGWERIVMDFEFKVDLGKYLEGLSWDTSKGVVKKVSSLADVIKFNDRNAGIEMPEGECCQEILIDAVQTTGYDSPLYLKALSECKRIGETEGLQAVFDEFDLDVLAIPSEGRATTVAAITGWPIATVPIGYYGVGSGMEGQPFGLSFIARKFEEKKLIRVMGAFEAAFEKRRVPSQLVV